MEKERIILAQAEEITELKEKIKYSERSRDYIFRQYRDEKERADSLAKENKRLFFEFSRALEVIRGAELNFNSSLIESEYQQGKFSLTKR